MQFSSCGTTGRLWFNGAVIRDGVDSFGQQLHRVFLSGCLVRLHSFGDSVVFQCLLCPQLDPSVYGNTECYHSTPKGEGHFTNKDKGGGDGH